MPGSLHLKSWGNVADGTTFTRVFQPGQVLFGKRRAYQRKAALADFAGLCSGDILVLEAKADKLLPALLPFLVHSDGFFDHAVRTSAGSLSPRTKFQDLAEYEFLLPPLDQQARLAELLWAADAVGEGYQALISKLENAVEVLVEKELYRVGVPRKRLATVVNGIVAGTSVNGINATQIASHEKAVLKVSAVGRKGFVPSESKVLINQNDFIPKFAVKAGNLLITRANTKELVGRVCLVDADYPNLMLCDKTLEIVVNENLASKAYLAQVLKSFDARKQIEGVATGTSDGMKNISQKEILSIEVPLPEIGEQLVQVSKLQALKAQEVNTVQVLVAHALTKQALINQIFSA